MLRAMSTQDARADEPRLIRTSVLIPKPTDEALRKLADRAERPLSWEIRRALEDYVERAQEAA